MRLGECRLCETRVSAASVRLVSAGSVRLPTLSRRVTFLLTRCRACNAGTEVTGCVLSPASHLIWVFSRYATAFEIKMSHFSEKGLFIIGVKI